MRYQVPVDIAPYITLCALDIIANTAMGVNVGAQTNSASPYVQCIADLTETMWIRVRSVNLPVCMSIKILYNSKRSHYTTPISNKVKFHF